MSRTVGLPHLPMTFAERDSFSSQTYLPTLINSGLRSRRCVVQYSGESHKYARRGRGCFSTGTLLKLPRRPCIDAIDDGTKSPGKVSARKFRSSPSSFGRNHTRDMHWTRVHLHIPAGLKFRMTNLVLGRPQFHRQAMLINSANLMGGDSEPDSHRGFGRVHLEAGMPLKGEGARALFVADANNTVVTERSQEEYLFDVNGTAGLDLRVTLSWIDPATSPFSSVQLAHDLDLSVLAPSGTRYKMWASGENDRVNVNERVIVAPNDVTAEGIGVWTVYVEARGELTNVNQAYSLVVSGAISPATGPGCCSETPAPVSRAVTPPEESAAPTSSVVTPSPVGAIATASPTVMTPSPVEASATAPPSLMTSSPVEASATPSPSAVSYDARDESTLPPEQGTLVPATQAPEVGSPESEEATQASAGWLTWSPDFTVSAFVAVVAIVFCAAWMA